MRTELSISLLQENSSLKSLDLVFDSLTSEQKFNFILECSKYLLELVEAHLQKTIQEPFECFELGMYKNALVSLNLYNKGKIPKKNLEEFQICFRAPSRGIHMKNESGVCKFEVVPWLENLGFGRNLKYLIEGDLKKAWKCTRTSKWSRKIIKWQCQKMIECLSKDVSFKMSLPNLKDTISQFSKDPSRANFAALNTHPELIAHSLQPIGINMLQWFVSLDKNLISDLFTYKRIQRGQIFCVDVWKDFDAYSEDWSVLETYYLNNSNVHKDLRFLFWDFYQDKKDLLPDFVHVLVGSLHTYIL